MAGIASDPSTRVGAKAMGLILRMPAHELLRIGLDYGPRAVSAVMSGADGPAREQAFGATGDEEARALAHMSSIWQMREGES